MVNKIIDARVQSHLQTINEQVDKVFRQQKREWNDRVNSFQADHVERMNDFQAKIKEMNEKNYNDQMVIMKDQTQALNRIADAIHRLVKE